MIVIHKLLNCIYFCYKKLNKKPNYTAEPVPDNYPTRGTLDITKAKIDLGYNPKFSLTEGLDQVLSRL